MSLFAKRTHWPTESNPLSRLAASLREDKIPFLDLTVSNPTKCGFRYLNRDLLKIFTDPKNLSYDPDAFGLRTAREAIVRYYTAKGLKIAPEQIFITASTSEAYSFLFQLLFEPGEVLLAPQPSYPLLDYLAALHDLRLERYLLDPSQNWKMNLKDTDAKALLLVNPNNPTGNYVHASEWEAIQPFCQRHGAALISDEVFLDYRIQEKGTGYFSGLVQKSNLSPFPLTFTLSGISKILGLPQMKLSWIVVSGPETEAREAIQRLEIISDTYLSASTPAQNALPEWLRRQDSIQQEILTRVRANYSYLKQKFSGAGPVRFFPVEGGWHAPLGLPPQCSDEDWACRFLKEDRVLTHPGYLFDFPEGSFIVLSLIVPEKVFREGLDKMAKRISGQLRRSSRTKNQSRKNSLLSFLRPGKAGNS